MNYKNYIGSNKAEVMAQIRRELGPDAVILYDRKIRKKGLAGFFGKKVVEVAVAVDDSPKKVATPKKNPSDDPKMQEALAAIRNLSRDMAESENESTQINSETNNSSSQTTKNSETEALANEVGNLKSMVSDLVNEMKNLKQEMRAETQFVKEDKTQIDSGNSETNETDFELEVRERLERKGVTTDTINSILSSFKVHGDDVETNEQIASAMGKILDPVENIKIGPKNQVLLFVGPTGVGKTTTLAKLAAKLALIDGCSVGLITADTFRIAAVEQLRTYSEILGIPFTVVYEPSEVKGVMEAYKDKDFILVDTAGRSHKSHELKEDLSNLLRNFENVDVFLVMSLTTGYNDMVGIVDSYSFIKDYKFIFTKLDESDSLANILNLKSICPAPMSYFTTGQNVPDDIEVANPDKIIRFILED